jgi:drug/metabolite transporter superfamily protein YnfA
LVNPVDSVSYSNISATTAAFTLPGGYYMVAAVATWGGGNVELQALGPDQSTWLSLPTPLKLTANGIIAGYVSPGQYRFAITTATGVYCSASGVPIS